MDAPPKLSEPKSIRFAVSLNFVVPGAGQFYLGQRVTGCLLAILFLTCFVSMLVLFIMGYRSYLDLAMSGHILEGHTLEQISHAFHTRWLIGLMLGALLVYLGALTGLSFSPQRRR